jgi:hypothetical protein
MKPEQHAEEQHGADREFLHRKQSDDREFGQRREDSSRQFQGQDADRQAKIEDMRARQAQAAARQNGGGQPANGGAY